jgi:flagellar motility protein MotE (MotC chaperone)
MRNALVLLKYIIAGTAISATFILTTMLVYLHTVHHGLNTRILTTLLQGKWPDPPVSAPKPSALALPDSLRQVAVQLETQRTIMKTMQIGLDQREQRVAEEERRLAEERKQLETLKAQIDSLTAAVNQQDNTRLTQVAQLVETMKPAQSAPILKNMPDNMIVDMLLRMKQKQAAKILAALEPDRAARLTQIMGMLN